MKFLLNLLVCVISAISVAGVEVCDARISRGQPAPIFSVKDIDGKVRDLSVLKNKPMIVLYFFDAESKTSQEGMLSLAGMAGEYEEAELTVWGVTRSAKDSVRKFMAETKPKFPIIHDTYKVSELYKAKQILPTVCIVGPGLKVTGYFQGGGKSTEVMLLRVAKNNLTRKKVRIVKKIADEVIKKNPDNIEAKAVRGYAAIEEGDIASAEKDFEELSRKEGEAEIVGKEGLTVVYAKKADNKKALEMAKEVEEKAPERGLVNKVKADIFYSQNKKDDAEKEYQKAIHKKKSAPEVLAAAYNQFGRFYASLGKYEKARGLYDQAVDIDPYKIEATSNKGVTYEKEGKWDDALKSYRSVLSVERTDSFASVLAEKAEEMVALQKNAAERERIDKLVKELAERYRSQKKSWGTKEVDEWTSRPMVITFVDFQEKGGLSERDGFSAVLTARLGDSLNASGRVQVVERVLIERLLEELNLGSSELADPETQLKLGRVLAAKLIGTGSLLFLPSGTLLNMRLIDTETSAIPRVVSRQIESSANLEREVNRLNREILKTIIKKYPLKGYVVQGGDSRVLINLGAKQGVVLGTRFNILEDQKPIKFKGKILQPDPKPIGEIEIVQLEDELSYANVISAKRTIKTEDKIRENVQAEGGTSG